MKNICITGANGFIGKYICKKLLDDKKNLIGIIRSKNLPFISPGIRFISVSGNWLNADWKKIFNNTECIVHCAAKVHSFNSEDSLETYCTANTMITKKLAIEAINAGVKRFIFLSTIKVNGESTSTVSPDSTKFKKKNMFTISDDPNPQDFYSISKFKAEKVLWEIAEKNDLEVVVIRLPLVYGNGVKGNLARLSKLIKLNIPLPFNSIHNKRSLIGIDNLVDLISRCIHHPKANGRTFLASDDEDLSTPDLIRLMALSMGKKVFLFSLPTFILNFLGFFFGKKQIVNRLLGSLRIDISYTKKTLNWTPAVSLKEGMRRMFQTK